MQALAGLTKGSKAALAVVMMGALCLLAGSYLEFLMVWPEALTVPMAEWITEGLGGFLAAIKPAMWWVSWVLGFGIVAAHWLLVSTPWIVVIGVTTAIGWYLGGWKTAALGFVGLSFVLASGYWVESMNTLALVFVSAPLALVLGTANGILAYEVPRVKSTVQAVLDLMQTIPTFAYLTPLLLLFGFGPVVGVIASAIYAVPPMVRNVLLGLERVEDEVREAAVMSGGTRVQQLFLVELPSAATQIKVGVNQCLMAALSMVIIAAVIGGFNDIGWEVLQTMRQAHFGQSLLAGLVVIALAIVIDRLSGALARERKRHSTRVVWWLIMGALVAAVLLDDVLPEASELSYFGAIVGAVDQSLGDFTREHWVALNGVKNGAMFYMLEPLRIGLDEAVQPVTWGVQWTPTLSAWLYAGGIILAAVLAWFERLSLGLCLLIGIGVIATGVSQLPWAFVLVGVGALGWVSSGWRLSAFCVGLLGLILLSGFWERAMVSLYLSGAAVIYCVTLGGLLGLWAAVSRPAWAVILPICDLVQTIPLFVFLIPVLMFFQFGEFSALLAITAYAIVPMIRHTRHGLVNTPEALIEAAISSGATPWQIMREVRWPYAVPTILRGLNQTIHHAFSMLVIAAMIGTTGLEQSIYVALGRADVGLGITAGAAMAILALVADRLVQGFAEERRAALGLKAIQRNSLRSCSYEPFGRSWGSAPNPEVY